MRRRKQVKPEDTGYGNSRIKRLRLGKCLSCENKIADQNSVHCEECKEFNRKTGKIKRSKLFEAGKCRCGETLDNNKRTCNKCLKQVSLKSKERRLSLKDQNICTSCGIVEVLNKVR